VADAVGLAADHGRKLDLMVGAAVGMTDGNALARPDDRAGRLQEQADALDFRYLVLVMQRGIGARLVEVLFVVDRRGDDLYTVVPVTVNPPSTPVRR